MSLQDKYAALIHEASAAGVANLQVREQDNVLYIDGEAPSADVKSKLWETYSTLDPEYKSADLVLNISAPEVAEYQVQPGDTLSKIGRNFNKSWQEIYDANKALIGDNPDLIQVGWKLIIP